MALSGLVDDRRAQGGVAQGVAARGWAVISRHIDPADDLSVAATARYRVTQRRRLLASARRGMVLVVAASLLDCVSLSLLHPASFAPVIVLNGAIGLMAVLSYLANSGRARHWPERSVFIVLVAVDIGTIALGMYDPGLGFVASGYLLLLPTVVALLVPWATRVHAAWLLWHVAASGAFALVAPLASLPGTRGDLLTLLIVAVVVSQIGHVGSLRARVISYQQISRIQALNRQARRDDARLQRINSAVEKRARTDDLTGLGNRLRLRLDLEATRARIARYGARFAILMMDLDRFKVINDDRGHVVGDEVLQQVAGRIMSSIRPEDGGYRFGGEEFVAIMKVDDPAQALGAAERVRRAVQSLELPNPGNRPTGLVTISVGVAIVGPRDLEVDDDGWFARADAALYRAKAGGRNRCELERPSSALVAVNDARA